MDEKDRATINKIADLIEQGSVGYRQITGAYHINDGVCVLGACFIGAQVTFGFDENGRLKRAIGITEYPKVAYPVDTPYWQWLDNTEGTVHLDDALISLNDSAGWTFEAIVNWLRSIAAEATINSEPA